MSESEFELVRGNGNVFRDFRGPDADLKQAKAIIAAQIIAVLDERVLAVRKAQDITGFAAADFSRIGNASPAWFTIGRPMKILVALDSRIQASVHIDPRRIGAAATQFGADGRYVSGRYETAAVRPSLRRPRP